MQNSANFAANNDSKANNSAANNKLQPSFTGNECSIDNELEKALLNSSERSNYAKRCNDGSFSLERKEASNNDKTAEETFRVVEVRQKKDDFGEKFSAHHVIDKDCCRLIVKSNSNNNKLENKQGDLFHLAGVSSRCSCSGRRRSTLTGLIELFEQKLQLQEPAGCRFKNSSKTLSALERLSQSNPFETRVNKKQRQINVCSNRVSRQNKQKQSRMRDIITPVRYEAATTTSNSCTDTDSIEFVEEEKSALERSHDDQQESRNKSLQHVAIKGAPRFPKPSVQKLTKTHWQPPTDGRKYEQRCRTPSSHLQSPRANDYSRLSTMVATNQRNTDDRITNGVKSCEFTSDSSIQSLSQRIVSLNDDHGGELTREVPKNDINNDSGKRVSRSISATLAAKRGRPIVKHQISSSRRLLNQLAKLRRLNEPLYRIKRPEKVEEVEKLIEKLERATQEWEEDENLLDRAESRDWPLEYHRRFSDYNQITEQAEEPSNVKSRDSTKQREDIEDFGCRLDVNPLEQDTIARSHHKYNMDTTTSLMRPGSYSANSTLQNRASRRSRAFADRFMDDLAVRRLSSTKLSPHHSVSPVQISNQPQMSYLLCSNAYTPSIDTNLYSAYETLDQRVRYDDLYYRNVKNKPESFEPPFGIPRQLTVAAGHSSASHYLRRQDNAKTPPPTTTTTTCACICNSNDNNNIDDNYKECCEQQIANKRSDSKVSFNDIVDRASGSTSVDSGVAAGSPYSLGRTSSATSRLTSVPSPLAPIDNSLNGRAQHRETPIKQYVYEDDVTQEVDLDEELVKGRYRLPSKSDIDLEQTQSICESPILERYKAEMRVTPIRRRPKISIENPRAKSPLLQIVANKEMKSPKQFTNNNNVEHEQQPKVQIQCYDDQQKRPVSRSMTELECIYDFQDEEDDDGGEEEGEGVKKLVGKQPSYIINTNYETSDSSLINETPSDGHLDYRGEQSRTTKLDTQPEKQQDKSGPSFSIGEYKPLNKPNLKIL